MVVPGAHRPRGGGAAGPIRPWLLSVWSSPDRIGLTCIGTYNFWSLYIMYYNHLNVYYGIVVPSGATSYDSMQW